MAESAVSPPTGIGASYRLRKLNCVKFFGFASTQQQQQQKWDNQNTQGPYEISPDQL